jgi:endonuclease YncB( thermonuclease family)
MRRLLPSALVGILMLSAGPTAQAKTDQEDWRESGTVVRVLDGDTFDMGTADGTVRVRINGIQAPESHWCGGQEARTALEELLPKGTEVRLASVKERSGNAPRGVWRLKRTVHTQVDGEWVDIAPMLLARGMVFPFPFIGEDAHNDEYLALGLEAHEKQIGVHDPTLCGSSASSEQRVELEVVADGPGRDTADSEFVMVFNGSDADLDLTGWMVQDTSPLNAYFFPAGSVVRADDYVVVYSSSGTNGVAPDGSTDDRYFYAATGMRWNNETADIALLFDDAGDDATGNLRDWLVLTPGSAEEEPLPATTG